MIFNRKDCCGEQTKKVSVKVGFTPPIRNCLWCLSGRQYTFGYNKSNPENRLVPKKPTCSEYLSVDQHGMGRGSNFDMLYNCSSDGSVPLPLLGRFEGPAENGQIITVKGKNHTTQPDMIFVTSIRSKACIKLSSSGKKFVTCHLSPFLHTFCCFSCFYTLVSPISKHLLSFFANRVPLYKHLKGCLEGGTYPFKGKDKFQDKKLQNGVEFFL